MTIDENMTNRLTECDALNGDSVSVSLIQGLLMFLKANDVVLSGELEAYLKPNHHTDHSRVSAARCNEIWAQAKNLYPSPEMGLKYGHYLAQQMASRHIVGVILHNSRNGFNLLNNVVRFHSLLHGRASLDLQVDESEARLVSTMVQGISSEFTVEAFFSAIIQIINSTTPTPVWPKQVRLPGKRTAEKNYQTFLGPNSNFECEQPTLVYSKADLQYPIPMADDNLFRLLTTQADHQLEQLGQNQNWEHKTRYALLKTLHNGGRLLDEVCLTLNLTPRTLQNKLKSEHTSFQTILNSTRQELAMRLLQQQTYSQQEITLLLGYSEQSAFSRAFKQWTGKTVMEFLDKSALKDLT